MSRPAKIALATVVILLAVSAGAGLWYLRSERFQQLARRLVLARLESATGMDVRIESLRLDVLLGTFDVKGFALTPRGNATGPLRITVDEAHGAFSVLSIVHPIVRLRRLTLLRPEIKLLTGRGSEPWNPEEFLRVFRRSLDLAVGVISVESGWLQLNQQRIPFELSVTDLLCQLHYQPEPQGYNLHVAYRNSHLLWAGRDLIYDLDADGFASLDGVKIRSARIHRSHSTITGEGSVRGWASPIFLFHAQGTAAASELGLIQAYLSETHGDIALVSDLRWDSTGFFSTGKFSAPTIEYRGSTGKALRGSYEIRKDIVVVRDVEGQIGPGHFRAEGEFPLRVSTTIPNQLKIAVRNVPLYEIARLVDVPDMAFENVVDSSTTISWRYGVSDLNLQGVVQLHGMGAGVSTGKKSTELQGDVAFHYERGSWYIPAATLSSPHTQVEASGRDVSTIHLKVSTDNISEPLQLLENFSASLKKLISDHPDLMQASGIYQLDGDVHVASADRVRYDGLVAVGAARWRSLSVDDFKATAHWEGPALQFRGMTVQKQHELVHGALDLNLPLQEGESVGFRFEGDFKQVALADLASLGIDIPMPVAGTASGNGLVVYAGGEWSGRGQFVVENGMFRGEKFDRASATVETGERAVRILRAEVVCGQARIQLQGKVTLPEQQLDLTATLAGVSLQEFAPIRERRLDLNGVLTGSGQIRGSVDNPAVSATFDLGGLRYASWDLGGGTLKLDLKQKLLQASGSIRSKLGSFTAQAQLSTDDGYPGNAVLDFRDWNMQRVIAGNLPAILSELSTALQGRIRIEGRFADPATLTVYGEMDGARLRIHDHELYNAEKIRFTAAKGKLRLEPVRVVGQDTSLVLSGVIPLDASPTTEVRLSGNFDLQFLEHVEKKIHFSGSVGLNVTAMGSLRDPQVIGQASLNNARLEYAELPFQLAALKGNIVFSRNVVRLDNVQGAIASGTVRFTGLMEHEAGEIRGLNIQISAQKARLPYPKDFRSVIDADLVLKGNSDAQVLSGEVNVIRAEYLRDFKLLEQLSVRPSAAPAPLTVDPLLGGIRLDLSIHSDSGLLIDNELTRVRGGMRLALQGTPAYPSLTGHVEVTEGTIFFRGSRFEVIHAAADFVDRNRINPILDVRAEADVKTYRLVLDLNGDLDHLNMNLTSDPPLSTVDIVSLLTTGKSREPGSESVSESARRQSQMTGLSAASLLSESLTGVVGKRVQRIFGLESFRVDPFLAGAENDPTARVTISERISKDITLTFSRNLSTNEEQIVVVEYDVNRNLSVVATRDEDGKFGLDFRFRKRFR